MTSGRDLSGVGWDYRGTIPGTDPGTSICDREGFGERGSEDFSRFFARKPQRDGPSDRRSALLVRCFALFRSPALDLLDVGDLGVVEFCEQFHEAAPAFDLGPVALS